MRRRALCGAEIASSSSTYATARSAGSSRIRVRHLVHRGKERSTGTEGHASRGGRAGLRRSTRWTAHSVLLAARACGIRAVVIPALSTSRVVAWMSRLTWVVPFTSGPPANLQGCSYRQARDRSPASRTMSPDDAFTPTAEHGVLAFLSRLAQWRLARSVGANPTVPDHRTRSSTMSRLRVEVSPSR